MKLNPWTLALASAGIVSLPAVTVAEESLNPVLSTVSSTTISGYVDTSAQWNLGTGTDFVPTYSFGGSSKADGFNLNVVKLALEKGLSPDQPWSAGYKADLWLGPDANALATQSTQNSGGMPSDFAIKQAYVALRAPLGNGLDLKMGVFDTVIGYEVTDAPYNPNFTRSYGYTIEPTTHTGVLASYAFCPSFAANFGVANTFGPVINQRDPSESYSTFLGSVVLTAPDEWGFLAGSTLTGGLISGYNAGAPGGSGDQISYYAGATFNTPIKRLKVGASFDYLDIEEQSGRAGGGYWAHAAAIYASYQLTEKMTVFARGEHAKSAQDALVFGDDDVYALTGTLQYDLWANVLSRLEFRWDHASTEAYGSASDLKEDSFILMANIVYKF